MIKAILFVVVVSLAIRLFILFGTDYQMTIIDILALPAIISAIYTMSESR